MHRFFNQIYFYYLTWVIHNYYHLKKKGKYYLQKKKEEKVKKNRFFFICLFSCVFCGNAIAGDLCVKGQPLLSQCNDSLGYYSSFEGKTGWNVSCGYNDNAITVKGISFCSSESGGSVASGVRTSINVSSTNDKNVYCWCKIVYPVNSKWINADTMDSDGRCNYSCASKCAYYMQNPTGSGPKFRDMLSDNLIDESHIQN